MVYCKTTNIALGGEGGGEPDQAKVEKFYSMFENICDYCFVENVVPMTASPTKETLKKMGIENFNGQSIFGDSRESRRYMSICEMPFYHFTVSANGDVYPCCSVTAIDAICLGNVKTAELYEIWNSEKLRKLRVSFVKNQVPGSCSDCGIRLYEHPNNLHEYADVIYKRLTGEE
jgi:radical SAM protein with 4Fe4S-binding SPASM domain